MLLQNASQAQLPPWLTFHTYRSCLPNKFIRQGLSLGPLFFFFLNHLPYCQSADPAELLSAEQINAFILQTHKRILTYFVLAAGTLVRIFST